MRTTLLAGSWLILAFGTPASAHRLDEYLQATTISVEKDQVQAQIRLIPGISVCRLVMAGIDTDGDGVISTWEQQVYAERVLGDLSLAVNGAPLKLRLISASFPKREAMEEGLGEIRIGFASEVRGDSVERKLVFKNHHERPIAAYLVNSLVPRDPDIRLGAQKRNYEQSIYELDYVQGGARPGPLPAAWWSGGRVLLCMGSMFLLARLAVLWRRNASG